MNNIHYTYADMGKANLGVPLLKKHLAAVDATLGPDHPLTLRSRYNLAFVYAETGRLDLAVPILEEVLRKEKARLGADHPSTLVTMSSLGMAYFADGKEDPGLRLMEEATAAQKESLGPDHGQTLTTLENLIDSYLKAKQPEKALPLLHLYWDAQKKRPRPKPRDIDGNQILKALHRLNGEKPGHVAFFVKERSMIAKAYDRTPEAAKAAPFLTECLSIRVREFPDEWTAFNTESMIGGSLVGQKKYEEAEPFLLSGYKGLNDRKGKLAPARRVHLTEALERLVQLYDAWGKKDDAAKWRRELAAHQREIKKTNEKAKEQT